MVTPPPKPSAPTARWRSLELIPRLVALAEVWQEAWGDQFAPFKSLCLLQSTSTVLTVPCPKNCGCFHSVIHRHDLTAAIGICRCQPPLCPDITLTLEEITPLELDRQKLGRAVARALQVRSKSLHLGPHLTAQIGTWSSDAVPLILTIHYDQQQFRQTVAELVATIRKPFILLAPTATFSDAKTTQLLQTTGAEFFPLETAVALAANGTLKPLKDPARLFARFSPKTSEEIGSPPPKPRYSIRKDCGVWRVIFDGQEVYIKHERGMFYVAYLLTHPNESFHALDLMAKIPEMYRHQLGLPEMTDPTTGKPVVLESHARLQQRSLALDDAQSMRALYRKQKELEAILDSEDSSEPEKAEALRELEALYQFLRQHTSRSTDVAHRAVDSVRKSMRRLHHRLASPTQTDTTPHRAIRALADHLHQHLLLPSASTKPAGLLVYMPPPNVSWAHLGL